MKLLRWKLVLPLLQFLLAVFLWLYVPFQFSREMIARMNLKPEQVAGRSLGLSAETTHLYFPPSAGRLLYAMNFPAYVLSNKVEDIVKWRTTPAFQFTINDSSRQPLALYNFGVRELTFFSGVCVLWFWVGVRVDRLKEVSRRFVPRWRRISEMIAALAVAILLLRACLPCLPPKSSAPPEHTIMTFGLIWPTLFLADFCLSLRHELG